MNYEEIITKWIDEHTDEMVECLQKLVRIPSISQPDDSAYPHGRQVAKVLDTALEIAASFGLEPENYDYQIGAAVLPGSTGKELGMIAHLDVVPVTEGWSHPPFACHVDSDGWIVGRGVDDNKGAAVIALFCMRAIKELALPFPHGIRLLFGCDEEVGMSDVAYYQAHGKMSDVFLVPDAGFPVCFAEKGIYSAWLRSAVIDDGSILAADGGLASNVVPDKASITLPGKLEDIASLCEADGLTAEAADGGVRITASGVSSHAASPEASVNAIYVLCDFLCRHELAKGKAAAAVTFIRRILTDYKGNGLQIAAEHPDTGYLTCIGGMLRFENGKLCLNINVRYPQSTTGGEITEKASAVCVQGGFSLEEPDDSVGTYHAPDDPLVSTLTDIFNRVTGQDTKPYMMGGGTYARKLPNAVAFGPGMALEGLPVSPYKGGAHQIDEHTHLRYLTTATRVYLLSLLAIAENPAIL